MRFKFERSQIEKVLMQRNGYIILAIASMAICLVQLLLIVFLVGREKIVIVPPMIEKSFWVSSQSVSPEYLSEMTGFFANLRLNITSESAQLQAETILRYTDPQYYDQLKQELIKESDKVAGQHLSIAFFPVNIKVDTKNLKAIITGDLTSIVGDEKIPSKRVSYLITYRYDEGRLLVKSFEEIENA